MKVNNRLAHLIIPNGFNHFYMVTIPINIYKVFPEIISDEHTLIAALDGEDNQTMKDFYLQLKAVFHLPRHCWCSFNSLNECLNDLDWLNYNRYHLILSNYEYFLKGEPIEVKYNALQMLHTASNEWANVPTHEGEENYRKKALFKVYLQDCTRTRRDLESLNFPRLLDI